MKKLVDFAHHVHGSGDLLLGVEGGLDAQLSHDHPTNQAGLSLREPGPEHPESHHHGGLGGEISLGQSLDRDLARDLERPEPVRRAGAGTYAESLGLRPSLPAGVERRLIDLARAGDVPARGQLIEACMPLISAAAATYRHRHVTRLELLQEGAVGVLRALERFDPERGVPFWGYATWWVRQAMQQLVAELTRPVVLSDRSLRNLARLKQAHREGIQETGREPDRDELAKRSGLTLAQVDDLLATERAPRSLEEPVVTGDATIGTFGELLIDPLAEDGYQRVLDAIEVAELHSLLAGLSAREREVLRARYGLDDGRERSLRQVGELLGLTGERVRQIEQRGLGKLASALKSSLEDRRDAHGRPAIDEPRAHGRPAVDEPRALGG